MQDFSNSTVRDIALAYPQTTRVFEEFKIDYCCGGRRGLDDACQNIGIDPQMLKTRLDAVLTQAEPGQIFPEHLPPSQLIDHIVTTHHEFTKSEIGRLNGLMDKVCGKHGQQHQELYRLREIYTKMANDMLMHMQKEEMMLFPFIKQMALAASGAYPAFAPPFGTVNNPIRTMMAEHETAAEEFRQMHEVTNEFLFPEDACPSFRALYAGLQDLEKDLHRHVHLENNVLFEQALELEAKVFGDSLEANSSLCCHTGH